MNHYPRHIGDWLRDTAHLSEVEECIYSRCIDQYYSREKPLPLDLGQCARLVRAASAGARKALATILPEFFTQELDGWHQKRCDEEIEHYRERADQARENGKRGGRPANQSGIPPGIHLGLVPLTGSKANQNHEPVTNKVKGIVRQAEPLPAGEGKSKRQQALEDAAEVIGFLNAKTGRQFEAVDANTRLILARFREGATVQDCKSVIAKKWRDWATDPAMVMFARPKTLFNATNFAQYKGELIAPEVASG